MENTHLLKDKFYISGISILTASLLVYLLPVFFEIHKDTHGGLFVVNYSLTLAYFFTLFLNRKNLEPEKKLVYRFIFLTIFLVSAYSLNRLIPVFEQSVPWFSAAITVSCVNLLALPFIERAPRLVKHTMLALAGASFSLFTYMSLYLLPLYGFGMLGAILVGFPLHVFVPALFLFNMIKLVAKPQYAQQRKFFVAGGAMVLMFASLYAVRWNNITHEVNKQEMFASQDNTLPTWINVARRVDNSRMLQKVLKGDMVYSGPDLEMGLFDLGRLERIDEPRKHDPLVQFALFFTPELRLSRADRLKFLASIYGEGHKTEQRLWSGDDLITETLENKVRIWPACHLSYTEKVISVRNTLPERDWNNPQEALYTFYLPEGGVVTSLSLWVNGVEEKAILTTKERADSAYTTIVGREARDPSVVHWKEGNKVTVRVFPVLNNSSRKFRIGFTAPLSKFNDELLYHDIQFDGPDKSNANEVTEVEFNEPIERKFSSSFVSKSESSYRRSGKYKPDLSMRFKAVKPAECTFYFNGYSYSIKPYHKKLAPATIRNIYLDINGSWKRSEYESILRLAGDKPVYAFDQSLERITDKNKDELFEKLSNSSFSVFPFHLVKEPSASLVISSSTDASCELADLTGTRFHQHLTNFLAKGEKIHLFNIGGRLSPYLKALKEYRTFNYDQGSIDVLEGLLSDSLFATETENENSIIVHTSQIMIEKEPGQKPASGPDHVMRLFAYNQVMYKLGKGIMLNRDISDDIVSIAREAYVVTPVSSLIVLETQKDYDRFDIKDQGASLKNASIGSSGAAPEPHEWALIIIGASLLLYMRFGKRQTLRFR